VSDYIPKSAQFPVRAGVAGLTGVMFLGLLKTAVLGPGIGGMYNVGMTVVECIEI
jgi:hypothetical protein